MWTIYDELIERIPEDLTVLECMLGVSWTLVKSERGLGIVKTIKGGKKGSGLSGITGMKLKDLAGYAKSWNMLEASLGLAAINSALNHPEQIEQITGKPVDESAEAEKMNAFKLVMPEIPGKKVAVIGHFPEIEKLQEVCDLSILEREPQGDDFPDSSCEYILPEQDYVFITGTAFTNKTMPRLLELSKKSHLTLVGPSVPISQDLFCYGVDTIASFIITDEELIWKAVQEGRKMSIFKHGGKMVYITAPK